MTFENFDETFKTSQMEVSDFLLTKCLWGMGMLRVVFNIEAGNYYSKSTFIMTCETCVHIGYFIHSGVFICFVQNCFRVSRYSKISYFGHPGLRITENAQP